MLITHALPVWLEIDGGKILNANQIREVHIMDKIPATESIESMYRIDIVMVSGDSHVTTVTGTEMKVFGVTAE